MSSVEVVADTNVISFMYNETPLGFGYKALIGSRRVGITGHTLSELRAGVFIANWGERRQAKHLRFLRRFAHVPDTPAMAEICGALRAVRSRIGEPIEWADAWAAACALWLEVPLVTHDRDHERIAGLRVLTLLDEWEVRETDLGVFEGGPLLLRESSPRTFHVHAVSSAHQ